jgi:hypothetical protein
MKRYTGQQALYEAISRSRAKAKQGNVLERLLPEVIKAQKPVGEEESTPAKPVETPAEEPKPVAKEPVRPVSEKPHEPVAVKDSGQPRWLGMEQKPEALPEKSLPAAARWRPAEGTDRPVSPPRNPVPAWLRLKPVQLNAGRVEVSVPYHIGIAAVLVLILAVLFSFRLGQKYPLAKAQAAVATKAPGATVRPDAARETAAAKTTPSDPAAAAATGGQAARSEGDHWIVLATHKNEAELLPVVEYFAKQGIPLSTYELSRTRQVFREKGWSAARLPSGDGYLLATRYLYSNPDRVGTDGYAVKQKIVELGRSYKAPQGRESFAATRFADAYGMKIAN